MSPNQTHNVEPEVFAQRRLITIKELRKTLGGISRDTVYKLFKAGAFKKRKIGASTYVLAEEVNDYIDRLGE